MNALNLFQLDPKRKIKVKLDRDHRIMYVNKYFGEVTQYKLHEVLTEDFFELIFDTSESIVKLIKSKVNKDGGSFFIMRGKNRNGSRTFWGIGRSYIVDNILNIEIKMISDLSIEKISELFQNLFEIERNTNIQVADLYLEGFLEEIGMDYSDFSLRVAGISESKAEKYFHIDIDDNEFRKKRKRFWF